tara:strand:+ start:7949 stop:8281 length:333 start_codon:yes stop_codon:yes gene_type:complete
MNKLIITDFKLLCKIGEQDYETEPQPLLITVEIEYPFPEEDNWQAAICWWDIQDEITTLIGNKQYSLVETIAKKIHIHLTNKEKVTHVRVIVKKQDKKAAWVGCEITSSH